MMFAWIAVAAAGPIEDDQIRIRAHLSVVEAALRADPPPELDPSARAERAALLDVLHAYRERGVFPHNHEAPGIVPVFRDHLGTDCAVGALIRASGRGDLADRIDRRWHLARVAEIAEPELAAWARDHGFTVAELAWIQPGYSPDDGCFCAGEEEYAPVCGDDGITYWNACVATYLAQSCYTPSSWVPGVCPPYENELCPDFVPEPAPILDQDCYSGSYTHGLCGPSAGLTVSDWFEWFIDQERECIEAAGDPFDGPDCTGPGCPPPPEEADPPPAPVEERGCSSAPATAGGFGWLAAAFVYRRRVCRRASTGSFSSPPLPCNNV